MYIQVRRVDLLLLCSKFFYTFTLQILHIHFSTIIYEFVTVFVSTRYVIRKIIPSRSKETSSSNSQISFLRSFVSIELIHVVFLQFSNIYQHLGSNSIDRAYSRCLSPILKYRPTPKYRSNSLLSFICIGRAYETLHDSRDKKRINSMLTPPTNSQISTNTLPSFICIDRSIDRGSTEEKQVASAKNLKMPDRASSSSSSSSKIHASFAGSPWNDDLVHLSRVNFSRRQFKSRNSFPLSLSLSWVVVVVGQAAARTKQRQ